jgi:two-component system response regulator (stage 0 sporulation protein F)
MKTILVVDDEPNVRRLIAETMNDEGYKVRTAGNGYEALAIIENESIDLVILDIKMPKLDGIGTLGKIREFKKDLPVILNTAYGEYKTSDYHTWVADAVVQKSSTLDELLDAINKIFPKL